jgi:hypothetical protein
MRQGALSYSTRAEQGLGMSTGWPPDYLDNEAALSLYYCSSGGGRSTCAGREAPRSLD